VNIFLLTYHEYYEEIKKKYGIQQEIGQIANINHIFPLLLIYTEKKALSTLLTDPLALKNTSTHKSLVAGNHSSFGFVVFFLFFLFFRSDNQIIKTRRLLK
jgi:hypothetical protein